MKTIAINKDTVDFTDEKGVKRTYRKDDPAWKEGTIEDAEVAIGMAKALRDQEKPD